ncbi:hypothetical protein N9C34_00580 [Candidatus Marinimicrobia bacterium]|nr:hypothetical protein [Candidatus Neomarinimicrobiota bacterium]
MKLLFIENRDKTFLFDSIAEKLNKKYSVSWIVQNHQFIPKNGCVYKIPYPKKNDLIKVESDVFDYISKTDRLINYFKGNDLHYQYYWEKIATTIQSVKPDVVFGESTQFHELIAIKICEQNNILYLNPSTTSFPQKRFFFYTFDKKKPLNINNENILQVNYDKIIKKINDRTLQPDYMQLKNKKKISKEFYYRFLQILEFLKGEKYTTPSLDKKILIDLKLKKLLTKWNKNSRSLDELPTNKKVMLYPLQMQPEANIDVWGSKFRDQSKLINDISKRLPNNWILVVKLNPKSKYEMNEELFSSIKNSNVFAINRDIPMNEIIAKTEIIATVTGTIAIEGFLGNVYTFCFAPSIVDKFPGSSRIRNLNEFKNLLKLFEDNKLGYAKQSDKVKFMKLVFKNSFIGNISDPRSDKNCLDKKNIEDLCFAFNRVLTNDK